MEISRHWRLKAQRYRLEGSRCPTCGQLYFPPRPVCPHDSAQTERIEASELLVLPVPNRTVDLNGWKESSGA